MSASGGKDRRIGDVLLAVTFVLTLAVVAIAVSGAGGTLEADPGEVDIGSAEDSEVDRSVLIGGGSLGDAERNPIGAPSGNETNPFQDRSDEIQFYVETDYPGYWRVDAYNTYSDGEWRRTGETTEYRDRLSSEGPVTAETTHNVTLQRDAAALPTVWQPATVTPADEPPIMVSSETGLQTTTPKPAGSTYTIESYCYAPDAEQLREADGDYPVVIEERYTDVPESLPDRVDTLGEEITTDTSSSIEAAEAIEDWLETNTAYSLEAETDSADGDPVDQFLFETQTGSAEHMAASTVVLLRSQDVPARYVTGYAPGEALNHVEDTYAVRGIHAHAWAEVYVSGHGWIPVDPTPADERVSAEDAFVGSDGEMVDVSITGHCPTPTEADQLGEGDGEESDNSQFDDDDTQLGDDDTPSEDGGDDEDREAAETNGETSSVIDIEASDPAPEPGQPLTVTVTSNGQPVEDAMIYFNDEQIALTDADGQVEGMVPFAESLVITASVETDDSDSGAAETRDDSSDVTVTIPISADMSVIPEPTAFVLGGEASVQALVNGKPIPEADVSIEGDQVGTTDDDGWAEITVPGSFDGTDAAITVQRGEISTQQDVPVAPLELSAGSERVLALPGQAVPMTVTVDGVPIEGAELTQNGDPIGTTDESGTTAVDMPAGYSTTVTASFAGQESTTTIENQLVPIALLGIVLTGFVGGVVTLFNRRPETVRQIDARTSAIRYRLVEVTTTALVRLEALLKNLGERTNGGKSVRSNVMAIVRTPIMVARWMSNIQPGRIVDGAHALVMGTYHAFRLAVASVGGTASRGATTSNDSDNRTETTTDTYRSVQDVWRVFVRLVVRRADSTATPGAIARRAIEKGFPRRPVRQLTETFRAAEYGPDTAHPRVEEATDALGKIEAETTETQANNGNDPGRSTSGRTPDERPTGD